MSRPLAFVLETPTGQPRARRPPPAEVRQGVLRFSDGSAVAVRPEAPVEAGGRVRSRRPDPGAGGPGPAPGWSAGQSQGWSFTAGPYSVDVRGSELELSWHERQQMFMVSLFSGQVAVRGPATARAGVVVRAGESLVARVADGFLRVGRGRALLDALPREDAERVSAALSAVVEEAAAEPPAAAGGRGGRDGPRAVGRACPGRRARFAGRARCPRSVRHPARRSRRR